MTIRLCAAGTATRQPDGFVQYEKKLKRKHLPIIALTANVFAEDSERALRAGMDAHMGKPVEVPQLLATMMHWIGQRVVGSTGIKIEILMGSPYTIGVGLPTRADACK